MQRNTRQTEEDILNSTFNTNKFPSVNGYVSQTTRQNQKILADNKTSA